MIRIIFPLIVCIATLVSNTAAAQGAEIADDAPDSYTVVKGDTLWGISGRFLKQPWRWPEVWRMNRDQIHNPHLIYPGQIVHLDRSGPWLSIGKRLGIDKRLPQIYEETLGNELPSIPLNVIEPFLNKPLVVDEARLQGAATIIATETNRVFTGMGDTVFAKNVSEDANVGQIFRPATPLNDPITGEIVAYEAAYLGAARVSERSDPVTLEIVDSVEEIGVGDLML
ncbi:MAG: peptidoglycan-binding protein, partial [Betaproteobacteria bacterium HGW-Betaproteobacteria-21]